MMIDDVVVIVTFVGWIVGITRSMDPAVLVSSWLVLGFCVLP